FAGVSVMAMALASVSCPRDKVPVAIGRVQSAQLLSAAVGPAVGGYVASHFGIRYAFFVTAGLCAVSLVGLILLFQEARPGEAARRPPPLHFRDVFRLPHFAVVLGLLLIAQFVDRGLSLLVPLKVRRSPTCSGSPPSPVSSSPSPPCAAPSPRARRGAPPRPGPSDACS